MTYKPGGGSERVHVHTEKIGEKVVRVGGGHDGQRLFLEHNLLVSRLRVVPLSELEQRRADVEAVGTRQRTLGVERLDAVAVEIGGAYSLLQTTKLHCRLQANGDAPAQRYCQWCRDQTDCRLP
jgi:hypothetical protein